MLLVDCACGIFESLASSCCLCCLFTPATLAAGAGMSLVILLSIFHPLCALTVLSFSALAIAAGAAAQA
jgi:hypothetical protein